MQKLIYVLNILAILGFPSLFVLVSISIKKMSKYAKQIKVLMEAQQAQMRSQLLKDYYTYTSRGFILEAELQDWINSYEAYHSLGANGIMDKRKERLLELETRQELN